MKTTIYRFTTARLVIVAILILSCLSSCKKDESKQEATIKDIDGNVYTSIQIGTQVWMVENLKVTKFRNGELIPDETDRPDWSDLTTAGYSELYAVQIDVDIYGKLYNWYAVNDNRKIAPLGWHVPSDEEWSTLITYLGGESLAGGKMKEVGIGHWCDPNTGATNESGFTALPGEVRLDGFLYGCASGFLWSATESESTKAFNMILNNNNTEIYRVSNDKKNGMSVRCIKD